jgi:hypothetical protein
MNTSQQTQFLSEILAGEPIPPAKLAFFRERFRDHLYELVLSEFLTHQQGDLTKAEIARRIGRKPEQITRWLGAPGNWTLETVSDLLLAISKAEPNVKLSPLENRSPRNFTSPEWLKKIYSSEESGNATPVDPMPRRLLSQASQASANHSKDALQRALSGLP